MINGKSYKKLTELGLKYQTDKAYYHLFTEFYNDYFETFLEKQINILEIGIFKGASILTLKEYFPNAKIYAIDNNPESANLKLGDNVTTYLCSQDDFEQLQNIFNNIKFDIIIEDGSHITSHQQSSIGFFFPFLNKKGIYICEDLHTSYYKNYIDTNITTMEMIEYYQQNKVIKSDIIDNVQREYLNENILDLQLHERTENALMCYQCKQQNNDNLEYCSKCNTILSPSNKSITSIFIHK